MKNKRQIGSHFEEKAAACLQKRGWKILERNYRCRQGEIDLICWDGRYLVFVEVKYRKNSAFGMPAEAVDARKQHRIRESAQFYLNSRRYPEDTPCRFDVVAILGNWVEVISDAF